MSEISLDTQLLKKISAGNRNALTTLFNKYYQPLCRFMFVFIPDNELVEELTANVFINLWNNREKIVIRTSLEAYLFRSAKNQAISHIRKKRLSTFPIEEAFELSDSKDLTPEEIYIENELNIEYVRAFQKLPPRAKLAFKLHRFDGLKYAEIAEIMGITISAVEKNIAHALKILHTELIQNSVFR